jgi:hypothetical protein
MSGEVGYSPCGCRDCFEIAIGEIGHPDTLCWECEEAECQPNEECEAPGAYGGTWSE